MYHCLHCRAWGSHRKLCMRSCCGASQYWEQSPAIWGSSWEVSCSLSRKSAEDWAGCGPSPSRSDAPVRNEVMDLADPPPARFWRLALRASFSACFLVNSSGSFTCAAMHPAFVRYLYSKGRLQLCRIWETELEPNECCFDQQVVSTKDTVFARLDLQQRERGQLHLSSAASTARPSSEDARFLSCNAQLQPYLKAKSNAQPD